MNTEVSVPEEQHSPLNGFALVPVGTVISDQETPTFETVRIKLKAGHDLKPGTLVRISVVRNEETTSIGRVNSAYECNPNESVESVGVRDTLNFPKNNYPQEIDSTKIYRLVEAELIEEIFDEVQTDENGQPKTDGNGKVITKKKTRSPQNLPNSGADVFVADIHEIIQTLGLEKNKSNGLFIGRTNSGTIAEIILKRQAIQRHFFICGTTGSGKSYAMGVLAEELVQKNLPIVFIDTQDEYSQLVSKLNGIVVEPGKDFSIRISSLTEAELISELPEAMQQSSIQIDVVTSVFRGLQEELFNRKIQKFNLQDILDGIPDASQKLSGKASDVQRLQNTVEGRLKSRFRNDDLYGEGVADWRKLIYPCLAINCKNLTSRQLQSVTTGVLRELQNLRLRGHIPPYVAVIDEAHLFVPEGTGSPCKQIIREGVRIGRHHGICMVLLTQSPVDIDKSTIRQCNTRLVFALEPDQLEAIKGVKADATDEMLRALPKMPQGTCLLSGTYESVKHTIPVKIRKRNTPNSEGGKTPDIFEEMQSRWIDEIAKLKGGGNKR